MIHIPIQGRLKSKLRFNNELITIMLFNPDGFYSWYYNKFLKYDGFADHEDERVLNEAINRRLQELADTFKTKE